MNARKVILRARIAYVTALQMINEAIQRPDSCQDDELLASVVLLALFEVRNSVWMLASLQCLQRIDFLLRQHPRME
jgi:hypothetical protein